VFWLNGFDVSVCPVLVYRTAGQSRLLLYVLSRALYRNSSVSERPLFITLSNTVTCNCVFIIQFSTHYCFPADVISFDCVQASCPFVAR
jgi:hypothetical protein